MDSLPSEVLFPFLAMSSKSKFAKRSAPPKSLGRPKKVGGSVWTTAGATLSEKNCFAEYGLKGEDLQGLKCQLRFAHGNPYRLYTRSEVEARYHAKKTTDVDFELKDKLASSTVLATQVKETEKQLARLKDQHQRLEQEISQIRKRPKKTTAPAVSLDSDYSESS